LTSPLLTLVLVALVLTQLAPPLQTRPPSQRPPTPSPRSGPILAETRDVISRAVQLVPAEESDNEKRLQSIRRAIEVMDRSDSLELVRLEALGVVADELADMLVGSVALFPAFQSAISEFHLMLMRGLTGDERQAEAAQRLLIERLRSDLAPPPAE